MPPPFYSMSSALVMISSWLRNPAFTAFAAAVHILQTAMCEWLTLDLIFCVRASTFALKCYPAEIESEI